MTTAVAIRNHKKMNHNSKQKPLFLGIAFFSGVAGLIYEVLWFREFALHLGNTAQAAALVLAILFCGLALGNALGGQCSKRVTSPLRAYALIELLMAVCGLGVLSLKAQNEAFALWPLFCLLAGVAFLMGATLPLLLQSLPGLANKLGREAPLLYGLNTLGGMFGAAAAGFILPLWLGVKGGFLCAILINLLLAIVSGGLSFLSQNLRMQGTETSIAADSATDFELIPKNLLYIAAFSGMGTLALEVLWTRMLSLVFQNSVYGFSFILVAMLFALAVAATWTGRLVQQGQDPVLLLQRCLSIVAFSIPLGVLLFVKSSHLESLFLESGPAIYVLKVFLLTVALLFPAMIAGGMILPLCWRILKQQHKQSGLFLGHFMSANLVGAVLGSLSAGFLLLPRIGLWPALGLIAFFYALAAIYLARTRPEIKRGRRPLAWSHLALVLPLLLLLPFFETQALKAGESLLYLQQGAAAQVAVIETRHGGRVLKVNNTYSLGSSKAETVERRMGQIPLLLHANPKSVAFVGLATGITASAILDHPVERATLIELLPEVVKGAAWFERENRGLLHDPRVEVVIADGRIAIPKSDTLFDVVISDLFVPWHAGATALYSLEYYEQAASRLAEDGFYVQWLPLYQMSEREFKIIWRTFQEVFPHVSLWRANFSTAYPIVALMGSRRAVSLDRGVLEKQLLRLQGVPGGDPDLNTVDDLMLFFAGSGAQLSPFFEDAVVNTDDRPYIEYLAPISRIYRRQLTGELLASRFVQFAQASESWRDHALAGAYLFQSKVSGDRKNFDARIAALKAASKLVPASARLSRIDRALQVSGM